ncbi:MAG TPA: hypothetical protein VED40_14790 [Azospirillaceae bacterium]|nr:hypothetical protein [Azospirillaceae bacterium]
MSDRPPPDRCATERSAGRRRSTPLEILEIFRRLDPDVAIKDVCAFLYVCENEGISVGELAFLLGTSRSTATRTVAYLSEAQGKRPALLDLRAWPQDWRVKIVRLTDQGRALRDRVNGVVAEARPAAPPDEERPDPVGVVAAALPPAVPPACH